MYIETDTGQFVGAPRMCCIARHEYRHRMNGANESRRWVEERGCNQSS